MAGSLMMQTQGKGFAKIGREEWVQWCSSNVIVIMYRFTASNVIYKSATLYIIILSQVLPLPQPPKTSQFNSETIV